MDELFTQRELVDHFNSVDKTLNNQNKVLEKILTQTTEHNHRMSKVEAETVRLNAIQQLVSDQSWGVWVGRHPIKFVFIVIGLTSFLNSDIRQPMFEFLMKFI